MTAYTDNYKLPLYEGTDKPDLADQYAEAMRLLDTALTAAQAARTELQNSVNTLNTNLAATNTQVETALANSALAKTDAANAVSVSQAAANTANAAGAEVSALKSDVTTNKTLVEEHVNYFTDLEITDEESAQDVNTKINNAYSGAQSNAQAITAINQMITNLTATVDSIAQRAQDEITFVVASLPKPAIFGSGSFNLSFALNKTKTIMKIWGSLYNSGASLSLTKTLIPGAPNVYGIKVNYDTGIRPSTYRYFQSMGLSFYSGTTALQSSSATSSQLVLGTDGYIYLFPGSSASGTWQQYEWDTYLQMVYYLSPADWPGDIEERE